MIEWIFYAVLSGLTFFATSSVLLAAAILAVLVLNQVVLEYLQRNNALA